ncbi:hypothetical protein QEJ31_10075 [Pigmentibacter sp. JX0631]|uniref:hypothetical protein n=1 Tax=Pigmentibacter sp. JX0631 TaxID=2976982 RepID=UPI0024693B8C|nr:hypothetical protein [Pigmentibacter sp. JX0631]WGL58868.1 hypothetical protein QEJ31_10075 [Pigmentibacter sp. JX0631]
MKKIYKLICKMSIFSAILALVSCTNNSGKKSESNNNQNKPEEKPNITHDTMESLFLIIKSSVFDSKGKIDTITPMVKDISGDDVTLYSYTGIVFRSETRDYTIIKADTGFKSQNKLDIPLNLLEAQGIGASKGASGRSGVSTAKNLSKAIGYCITSGGPMYVINTAKIGALNTAYDFDSIVVKNYPFHVHDFANEVNVTYIPKEAIIGWYPNTFCTRNNILTKTDAEIDAYVNLHFHGSKEQFAEDVYRNNSEFIQNPDYVF